MNGRQKPNPQTESGNDLKNKEVIDLTKIIEEGDDYDVIDLNNILEQPDQAWEAEVEPDEAAIPLVNALPEEETTDLPEETDDGIIDLADMTASPEAPAAVPDAESAAPSFGDEEDEEVIDLMDLATTLEAELSEAEPQVPISASKGSDEATEDEDDVIDLMDMTTPPEDDTGATGIPEAAAMPEETDGATQDEDDVIDLMDVATAAEGDTAPTGFQEPAATPEEADGTTQDDDDVIDLMDVATAAEGDTAATGFQEPAVVHEETDGTMQDEPVIDLLDAVEPQTAEAETTVEADDEFTDLENRAEAVLTDARYAYDVETPEEAAETAGPDSDFMVFEDDEAFIGEVDDRPEALPGAAEPAAAPLFVPVSPSEPVQLTEMQVEAALERTIEKIYGERIEQLMIRAIEKTVTREIARIKNALLEEDDDMIG